VFATPCDGAGSSDEHGIPSNPFAGSTGRQTALAPHSVVGFVPGHGTLNIAPGWQIPPGGQSPFSRHAVVGELLQNPLQIAEAHCPPPAQSWSTEQTAPLFDPPAHFFATMHVPPSLIVPIWIVDRNSPDPMPPAPEKRVIVGLLQMPPGTPPTVKKCPGVALHAVPHFPPDPHWPADVHGAPSSVPAVQICASSLHATSPLPLGMGRSAAVHVASSGAAHADPGQSPSSSQ